MDANRETHYASILLNVSVLWIFGEQVSSVLPSVTTKLLTLFIFSLFVAQLKLKNNSCHNLRLSDENVSFLFTS